ncbi:Imm31 family immunity protein [Candidatus Entotheonella palauensis]|uniref:Uncharacterized protein n=1 Tax=Candidatus Entotheonella gemina TaxID=1429439 RepID=W4M938_9BACT|nr:Imm31 family immunity protein [Candidatus Entotheonella palauensis]ETX06705.1 MAG: hypothetical protein ETSY2_15530 [Candidatus Entotheonella gemina]
MPAKFQFYEVVKVVSAKPELSEISGLTGVIMGMSENEDGHFGYAVSIFDVDEGWCAMEEDLISMGTYMRREDFYDGSSVRVRVDPETGEGHIVEWNLKE